MENLFLNIQKYRPRENLNPLENFFTEILTFIFQKEEELLKTFLKNLDIPFPEKLVVKSQTCHQGKFIDLEITGKDFSLFIEIKIVASLHESSALDCDNKSENQLKNYVDIQKKKQGFHFVVLLSQFYEVIPQSVVKSDIFAGKLFWKDIYKLIKKYHTDDSVSQFLISQFLDLMKNQNMHPVEKINMSDIQSYVHFTQNIEKFFEECLEFLSQKFQKECKKLKVCNYNAKFVDFLFTFGNEKYYLDVYFAPLSFRVYDSSGMKKLAEYPLEEFFFNLSQKKQINIIKEFLEEVFKKI